VIWVFDTAIALALLFVFSLFDIDLTAIFIDLISWLLVLSWKCLAFRFVLMGIDVC
jgi:hypothetical protein